eukprot:2392501-Pyramimonas_sp.AAC.1
MGAAAQSRRHPRGTRATKTPAPELPRAETTAGAHGSGEAHATEATAACPAAAALTTSSCARLADSPA